MKYEEFEKAVEVARAAVNAKFDAEVDAALEAATKTVAGVLDAPKTILGMTYPVAGAVAGSGGIASLLTAGLTFLSDKLSWLPML